ncbi:P-loop NTPase fold protein [Kribbella sp. NPDC050241]|uniref:KAP family P-loop NTPase fold protein n=1 Tax=Kribbella sp. NPDC050241 TaxID=3364115 RepID=UPI003792FC0E
MSQENLFSDDPVEHVEEDQLDRVSYVEHVAAVMSRVRQQGTASTVVAIIGSWGSGKSSILSLVQAKLPDSWLMARFDPWGYTDVTAMMFGFFGELSSVLPDDSKGKEVREKVGKVVQLASPLGKLTGLAGFDSSSMIDKLGQLIAGGSSISAALKSAEESLKKLDSPVLMVIDDLDCLEPEELLMVFRLIRSLGRMPNLYYLLSYDERTLLDVLMRTELAFNDQRRAQEYLEKMVQVRLDLPPLREKQASVLFEQMLDKVIEQTTTRIEDGDRLRILKVYETTLRHRLQTPRAIRRFLAQVDAFWSTVNGEIDFCDFLILTWLRTFEPSTYRAVQEHRAALTGGDVYERLFQRDHKGTKQYWIELLDSAGIPAKDREKVLELLADLFIPIRSAMRNSDYNPAFYDEIAARQGVGHEDYFDRYFAFTVTSDDIPDAMVQIALSADPVDADETATIALSRLRQRMLDDSFRAGRKVTAAVEDNPALARPAVRLICWAARELQLSEAGVADPWPISALASATLARVPNRQLGPLLEELTEDINGLDFLGSLAARLTGMRKRAGRDDAAELEWSAALDPILRPRLESRVRDEVEPSGRIGDQVANLIWSWRFIDVSSCQSFCRELVDRTDLVTVLSQLMPRNHGQDGETLWVSPLRRASLVALFGLDYLGDLESYGDAPDIPDWDDARLPDSPENRTNRARASLKAAHQESPDDEA